MIPVNPLQGMDDSGTSSRSSSFASDLSPRMEWLSSKFAQLLDTADTTSFGIELDRSSESMNSGRRGKAWRPETDLVLELKERIAKYAMPTNESTSPSVLRQLDRSLSTLHELSEDREDCSSVILSSFSADETARMVDRSPNTHAMRIPRLRIEDLNPEELVNGLFSTSSATLSQSTDEGERVSDTPSTALLPPLPKKPTPPSRARRRGKQLSSEVLAVEEMPFEEFQDEPRRIGRRSEQEESHNRSQPHSSHRNSEDPESPPPPAPQFRLLADGFRLRILD